MNNNPIVKNSTVKYKDGYVMVKSLFKTHATLCTMFSHRIIAKKVPLTELTEAYDEWYKLWTESESYKCM